MTHWFRTPEDAGVSSDDRRGSDAGVNSDDHFGSDERTLRFLAVALPTLMHQLRASLAVVALPWGVETGSPTLTVIGLGAGESISPETRPLIQLASASGPPFWHLEPYPVATPAPVREVASNRLGQLGWSGGDRQTGQ